MVQGLSPLFTVYRLGPTFLISVEGSNQMMGAMGPEELLNGIADLVLSQGIQPADAQSIQPTFGFQSTPPLSDEGADLIPPIAPQVFNPDDREDRVEVVHGKGGREHRFKVGYDENPLPPPPDMEPLPPTNDPVIRGQLSNIRQLSTVYLRGQYQGKPFTYKDWAEGIRVWAPDVPKPMAENVLSEMIAEAREDREGI